jgi:pyroglutamyl-peptidase
MSSAAVAAVVLLLAVAVLAGVTLAGRAAEAAPPVALLTAFEPFGEKPVNASWEAVKGLDGETIAGHRVAVALLPVVYDGMAAPLEAAVARHRPAVVLSFGLGRGVIHVERLARNGYHPARPRDNAGKEPPRAEVVPGGRAEAASALPVDAILAAYAAAGLGAEPSDDAGGYLCNECFYRLMTLESPAGKAVRARGFVHLPDLDAPNPMGGTYTVERLREAVRIALERTLAAEGRP